MLAPLIPLGGLGAFRDATILMWLKSEKWPEYQLVQKRREILLGGAQLLCYSNSLSKDFVFELHKHFAVNLDDQQRRYICAPLSQHSRMLLTVRNSGLRPEPVSETA